MPPIRANDSGPVEVAATPEDTDGIVIFTLFYLSIVVDALGRAAHYDCRDGADDLPSEEKAFGERGYMWRGRQGCWVGCRSDRPDSGREDSRAREQMFSTCTG